MRILGVVFVLVVMSVNGCRFDVGNDDQVGPIILRKIEPSSCVEQQKSVVENAKLDNSLEALINLSSEEPKSKDSESRE